MFFLYTHISKKCLVEKNSLRPPTQEVETPIPNPPSMDPHYLQRFYVPEWRSPGMVDRNRINVLQTIDEKYSVTVNSSMHAACKVLLAASRCLQLIGVIGT